MILYFYNYTHNTTTINYNTTPHNTHKHITRKFVHNHKKHFHDLLNLRKQLKKNKEFINKDFTTNEPSISQNKCPLIDVFQMNNQINSRNSHHFLLQTKQTSQRQVSDHLCHLSPLFVQK
jgi:hypothetical protein